MQEVIDAPMSSMARRFQLNGTTLISDSFTVVVPEPSGIVLAVLGVGFMLLSQPRRRAWHVADR